MKITMDDSRITSVAQLADLIKSAQALRFLRECNRKERYAFIAKTIKNSPIRN